MNLKRVSLNIGIFILVLGGIWACAHQSSIHAESQESQTVQAQHPDVDFSLTCLECHTEMTPAIVKEWSKGMHGEVNVKCYVCHGDGEEEFYPTGTDDGCLGCHSPQEMDFSKVPVSSCYDCHDGHSLEFHNE